MKKESRVMMNQETKKLMTEDAPLPGDTDPESSYGSENNFQPSLMEQGQEQQDMPQAPQTQQSFQTFPSQPIKIDYAQGNIDEIEELVESVVDEKWRSLVENFGDIGLWKRKVATDIASVKQELIRLENRFDNLQKAILGKVRTYDQNILEVGSEIRALEKVLQRILEPLTTNIKELERLTKELKNK